MPPNVIAILLLKSIETVEYLLDQWELAQRDRPLPETERAAIDRRLSEARSRARELAERDRRANA